MKKMYNYHRRGFTLVEIIVVVAIVVILSGAAFVGVAVTIDRAKASGDAAADHGRDFEDAAWNQVKSISVGAADFFDIYDYTPVVIEDEDDADDENTTENNDADTEGNDVVDDTTGDKTDDKTDGQSDDKTTVIEEKPVVAGGSTGSFTTSQKTSGTHWDGSVDRGYDQWGNHLVGANVPDTTSEGSVSFGSTNVSSFTISVPGKVMWYQCTDWRYSVEDNGNGTYTFTYTANQYEHNPPISEISMKFNVEGENEPNITVISYTPYN